ncbi:MAG: hypothetical protein WAV21_02050 [Minisyncoccia bacterium]
MKKRTFGIYPFLLSIPDRMYPFAAMIEGKKVRGRKAYEETLAFYRNRLGPGHLGYKLFLYRQLFHFIGSLLVIVAAALISKTLFGSEVALYVLLVLAVAAVSFQEFYLHPRMYKQLWRKGAVDWFAWVGPISIYIFTHLR